MQYTPSRYALKKYKNNQGASWTMTFADLLSLIITFFVLLYSMSSIVEEDWKVISKSLSQTLSPNLTTKLTYSSSELTVERVDKKSGSDLDYLFTVLSDKIKFLPNYKTLLKLGKAEDRIIISLLGNNFFIAGSAELPKKAKHIVNFLGQILSTTKNKIEVVSFADPRPPKSDTYPSNWELSLNRAIIVSNALRKYGYPYKIDAFGRSSSLFGEFASDMPLLRKQKLSRRIDIIVRSEKATY
jgi:chemotaxis protein MotB